MCVCVCFRVTGTTHQSHRYAFRCLRWRDLVCSEWVSEWCIASCSLRDSQLTDAVYEMWSAAAVFVGTTVHHASGVDSLREHWLTVCMTSDDKGLAGWKQLTAARPPRSSAAVGSILDWLLPMQWTRLTAAWWNLTLYRQADASLIQSRKVMSGKMKRH